MWRKYCPCNYTMSNATTPYVPLYAGLSETSSEKLKDIESKISAYKKDIDAKPLDMLRQYQALREENVQGQVPNTNSPAAALITPVFVTVNSKQVVAPRRLANLLQQEKLADTLVQLRETKKGRARLDRMDPVRELEHLLEQKLAILETILQTD